MQFNLFITCVKCSLALYVRKINVSIMNKNFSSFALISFLLQVHFRIVCSRLLFMVQRVIYLSLLVDSKLNCLIASISMKRKGILTNLILWVYPIRKYVNLATLMIKSSAKISCKKSFFKSGIKVGHNRMLIFSGNQYRLNDNWLLAFTNERFVLVL